MFHKDAIVTIMFLVSQGYVGFTTYKYTVTWLSNLFSVFNNESQLPTWQLGQQLSNNTASEIVTNTIKHMVFK
jgi:hypothetical protein